MTEDRIIHFLWTAAWGFSVGICLEYPETPAWFWAFLIVWGMTAFFMPELMADAERRGRRLAQWIFRITKDNNDHDN